MGFFVYIYRSLIARARANALTVLAIALFVAGGSLGLVYYRSLDKMFMDSASPTDIVVLAKGAPDEEESQLELESARRVSVLDGIKTENNVKLLARELVAEVFLNTADFSRHDEPAKIRGIEITSLTVHRIHLLSGALPQDGSLQVLLGRRVAKHYSTLKVGDDLFLPGGASKIVGIFEAGGSPYEDEVWTMRSALEIHTKTKSSSSLTLVAENPGAAISLVDKINTSKDLEVQAIPLTSYRESGAGLRTVVKVVLIMLVLLSVVATFAIAMTMNAAVAVRMPELAAMAAIGIRKSLLARLVVIESLLLALIGALLGIVASEIVRRKIDVVSLGENPVELVAMATVPLAGLGLGLVAGVLGGIVPSLRVRRMSIVETLR